MPAPRILFGGVLLLAGGAAFLTAIAPSEGPPERPQPPARSLRSDPAPPSAPSKPRPEESLYEWTSRDLAAVARWFGEPGLDHDSRQEACTQIVQALLLCDPEEVVPALRTGLPESTARELLAAYFRAWGAREPAAAAGMLVRLAAAEPRAPAPWHDLGAQVAAQWMESDPDAAIAWVGALPEGAGKSAALLQISYRWVEKDAVGASAFAAKTEDPRLVRVVAAKWAEASPSSALAWARGLPAGSLRDEALSGAATIRESKFAAVPH